MEGAAGGAEVQMLPVEDEAEAGVQSWGLETLLGCQEENGAEMGVL